MWTKLIPALSLQNKERLKGQQKPRNLLFWTLVNMYRLEMIWHSLLLIVEIAVRLVPLFPSVANK